MKAKAPNRAHEILVFSYTVVLHGAVISRNYEMSFGALVCIFKTQLTKLRHPKLLVDALTVSDASRTLRHVQCVLGRSLDP